MQNQYMMVMEPRNATLPGNRHFVKKEEETYVPSGMFLQR